MSKLLYQAVTWTWSSWAPGRLATSPSSRCCWPRTASPSAWWRSTWWWPSWAVSSRSLSLPPPTSHTPSSGIKQTPTVRGSLASQRQWVSTCCEAAVWRCCGSVGSLTGSLYLQALNLGWTFENWCFYFSKLRIIYPGTAFVTICKNDLAGGVESWNPPSAAFLKATALLLTSLFCMYDISAACADYISAYEAVDWEKTHKW